MKTFTKLIQRAKLCILFTSVFLISFYANAQCDPNGCELILNGSFESGNDGSFTSTYDYDADGDLTGLPNYHDYTITNDALDYEANCGDQLMWVDGDDTYPFAGEFWSQSVFLVQGVTYTFCFDAVNVHPGTTAETLEVRLFNGAYTSLFLTPGVLNTTWTTYTFNFTAPSPTGTYEIQLWETDPNAGTSNGNDFAIDCISLTYPCECHKCECQARIFLDDFVIDDAGQAFVFLNVGGAIPDPVSKFRITMVNYHSNVDVECLKCSLAIQEMYGTIYFAPALSGTLPAFGPYDLSIPAAFSREVTWCFDPAITFDPASIPLKLHFPPILDLKCCTNSVSFCFRVEFWTNECLACDYLVCWDPNSHEPKKSLITTPEQKIKNIIQESRKLNVIPNPASNNFTVIIPKDNLNGTLQVFDINGSLIKEAQLTSEQYTINTKAYSDGIYFIRYKTSSGSFEEKVVIKK